MSVRGLHRGATVKGYATPTNAPIYIDSDDNIVKVVPAGSGSTEVQIIDASSAQTLTNKTINGAVGTMANELLAATEVLVAADSGKVLFLNHATEFDTMLPAPAAGLRFTFIVTGAPSGANYTITSPSANQILGQVYTVDVNSATDPDFEVSGSNTISFVTAKSVAGDRVDIFCDGTLYYAYAFCSVFDAITFTDV
jgi:hypothetical protein